MLRPHKLDRVDMTIRAVLMLLTWAMIIWFGFLAWTLGGLAWFAYAAVLLLNGIFWECEGTRMAAAENERVSWAMYRELRVIRRRLPKTARVG